MPSFHGNSSLLFFSNCFPYKNSPFLFSCKPAGSLQRKGYSKDDLQCLCLRGRRLLQRCLLVSGYAVLLTYQKCLFLAKRMLQSHRCGYAASHALKPRLLQTQLRGLQLRRFPSPVPDLSSAGQPCRQPCRPCPLPWANTSVAHRGPGVLHFS